MCKAWTLSRVRRFISSRGSRSKARSGPATHMSTDLLLLLLPEFCRFSPQDKSIFTKAQISPKRSKINSEELTSRNFLRKVLVMSEYTDRTAARWAANRQVSALGRQAERSPHRMYRNVVRLAGDYSTHRTSPLFWPFYTAGPAPFLCLQKKVLLTYPN